jgi:hypothetical protein
MTDDVEVLVEQAKQEGHRAAEQTLPPPARPWWRRPGTWSAIIGVIAVIALGVGTVAALHKANDASATADNLSAGLGQANVQIRALGGTPVPTPTGSAQPGATGSSGAAGSTGATGAAGRGIKSTRIVAGNLIVNYSDGRSKNVGRVAGATGAAGRGIKATAIADTQHLVITYTDGRAVDVGRVVGQSGTDGDDGAAGPSGVPGGNGTDGVSVKSLSQSGGRLIVTYSDGRTEDAGPLPAGPKGDTGDTGKAGRGITSIDCSGLGVRLRINYSDGTVQDATCGLDEPTDTSTPTPTETP